MKRLFVAINIPESLKERLTSAQKILQETGANVKWVEEENFHLTLKFLGDTSENKIILISQAIKETSEQFSVFELNLKGIGSFPIKGRPRVIWSGIQGQIDKLIALQKFLEQRLEAAGFPLEKRKYSPHLTIGRPREYGDLKELPNIIDTYKAVDFGKWQVTAIKLMESTLTKKGSIYTVVDTVALKS